MNPYFVNSGLDRTATSTCVVSASDTVCTILYRPEISFYDFIIPILWIIFLLSIPVLSWLFSSYKRGLWSR